MYTTKNFRTKKALKQAVKDYNDNPKDNTPVTYYQPGMFGGNEPKDGSFCVEMPHYPEPHRSYATCKAKNGIIVSVK